MVTVEDLHWADGSTLAYLAVLAPTVAEAQALLLMTSRLEGDPLDEAWRGASQGSPLTTIDLGALRPQEARELAGQFPNVTTGFAERCVERAAGSPFMLGELLRAAGESAEEDLPGSVQSLVLARIDHLGPADREALRAASIFGRRFALDALWGLLGKPDYRCEGWSPTISSARGPGLPVRPRPCPGSGLWLPAQGPAPRVAPDGRRLVCRP